MAPIISLLIVVAIALTVTRIASVALVHTGLSREVAGFQARSAFTGTGFTTRETEDIVNHPVRRRIVSGLMLAGNIGLVTAVSSLLLSFIDLRSASHVGIVIAVLVAGLGLLTLLGASKRVDRVVSRLISAALMRFTSIDARDYARLLHLREDYGVTELLVQESQWLAGCSLREAGLAQEGVLVLGIECPGNNYIGAPGPEVQLRPRDRLILYGRTPRIAEIDRRGPGREGDVSHLDAVREQAKIGVRELERAGR